MTEAVIADGLKATTGAARMAAKREVEAGRMHEAGGTLLPGIGD